ncbi:hypothetical protein GJ496_010443 [Pomphorhynchus laevis]|nr:hypothetical protein GJ496_010443 [Pomphorhynchus laevis]
MSLLKTDKRAWKNEFLSRFLELLDQYPSCLIVNADNISSHQMQKIRINLRGQAVLIMGKNTRIRKAISSQIEKNPAFEKLIPHVKQNIGFVFTDGNLRDIKEKLIEHKVKAYAKVGAIAPVDVFINAQQTTMGPDKTSFFQALSISTKITKGCVEILNDVHLIKKDSIVGASEAALLNMLNVLPFEYTLSVKQVFEHGACYDPFVLDITSEDIISRLKSGIQNLASISLATNYPTKASSKMFVNLAFRRMLAVGVAADIDCPQVNEYKAILSDPSKLASMAAAAAPAPTTTESKEKSKAETKKEESEESSDEEGMFGLFD